MRLQQPDSMVDYWARKARRAFLEFYLTSMLCSDQAQLMLYFQRRARHRSSWWLQCTALVPYFLHHMQLQLGAIIIPIVMMLWLVDDKFRSWESWCMDVGIYRSVVTLTATPTRRMLWPVCAVFLESRVTQLTLWIRALFSAIRVMVLCAGWRPWRSEALWVAVACLPHSTKVVKIKTFSSLELPFWWLN